MTNRLLMRIASPKKGLQEDQLRKISDGDCCKYQCVYNFGKNAIIQCRMAEWSTLNEEQKNL